MFLKLFPRYAGRARRRATVAGDNLRDTAVVVVRKKEDRNSLRQDGEGDAREIDLEASLMS